MDPFFLPAAEVARAWVELQVAGIFTYGSIVNRKVWMMV
jgi:hypothetical protein